MPGLDFSNLKHVKDFKDWYAYAKKLEDAIALLNLKINTLETDNVSLTEQLEKAFNEREALERKNLALME